MGTCSYFRFFGTAAANKYSMMTNETALTLESGSKKQPLADSRSATTIPAAFPKRLISRRESTVVPEKIQHSITKHSSNRKQCQTTTLPVLRKTKIIATLGAATENGDVLRSLVEAGVSVFRLNRGFINRESALKAIYVIRSVSTELQRPVSILLDAQLPAARDQDSSGITENDWADIRLGLESGVDWLALSPGPNGESLPQLRRFLASQKKNNVRILARMANRSTPVAFGQIIHDADGLILDGSSPDNEFLRRENLLIVQNCLSARKPVVITAGSIPNLEGALSAQPDALLLEEQDSFEQDPALRLRTLDDQIRREESRDHVSPAAVPMTEQEITVAAALQQADETKADAILIFTRSENPAVFCAALRPSRVRVIVITPDVRLARRLSLSYAIEPIVLPFCTHLKATISAAEKVLLERGYFTPGAKVVFLTDQLDDGEPAGAAQIRVLSPV